MAKLTDKFFNRVIEGELNLEEGDASGVAPAVNALIEADNDILSQIKITEGTPYNTVKFPEGILPIYLKMSDNSNNTVLIDFGYKTVSAMSPLVTTNTLEGSGVTFTNTQVNNNSIVTYTTGTKVDSLVYLKYQGNLKLGCRADFHNLYLALKAVSVNSGTITNKLSSLTVDGVVYGCNAIPYIKVSLTYGEVVKQVEFYLINYASANINSEDRFERIFTLYLFFKGTSSDLGMNMILSYDKTTHTIKGINDAGQSVSYTFDGAPTVETIEKKYIYL